MEFQGAKIDKDVLKQLERYILVGQIDHFRKRNSFDWLHKEFNIASPKQLGEVLI